jgi:hypothetical protein
MNLSVQMFLQQKSLYGCSHLHDPFLQHAVIMVGSAMNIIPKKKGGLAIKRTCFHGAPIINF